MTATKLITIKCLTRDGQTTTLSVPVVFTVDCLAVHKRPQYDDESAPPKRVWQITHIPTGYSVSGRVTLKTKAIAIQVCKDLAALDWSNVTPDGGTSHALSSCVRDVYVAHGLLT